MNVPMTPLQLYGGLGKLCGRVHSVSLDTGSPAEAIRYLRANFPGVDKYFMEAKDHGIGFAVFRGKKNLTKDELK